jgi:hypothetical protein
MVVCMKKKRTYTLSFFEGAKHVHLCAVTNMFQEDTRIFAAQILQLPYRWHEALPKLFHCSVRNTWATWWLGMTHRTSGLNKILVPRVNCRPTARFLAVLSAKFPLNLCSRLRFFEPKHTTSTLCTCESSHLDFNCCSARGGGIGYYSTTCIKLAMVFILGECILLLIHCNGLLHYQ